MTLEDVSVTGRPARPVTSALRTVLRAPADARARRELLFCLAGLPFAIPLPVAGFILALIIGRLVTTPAPDPTPGQLVMALVIAAAMLPFLVLTGAARRLGGGWRRLAALLLGVRVPAPVPLPPRRGPGGRMTARLRDRPGWRAAGYLMAKFPVALFGWYAVFCWVAGVVNISYPFWWLSFRNHAPDVHLSPVPVFTPFGWGGRGTFYISTFPGTFAALGAGAFMLLAAPWLTRTAAAADRWLIQGLLGPGTLRQRLADREQTRALAIDDSAARLRQLGRNRHDGAQIRLATLAMNL
ncbi:MAG: sensor domain-containing protein, partial [Nocardiopsaceae bacterium]|nr:sensor domain-containing protein [Nocardiopsaceae bacterium]